MQRHSNYLYLCLYLYLYLNLQLYLYLSVQWLSFLRRHCSRLYFNHCCARHYWHQLPWLTYRDAAQRGIFCKKKRDAMQCPDWQSKKWRRKRNQLPWLTYRDSAHQSTFCNNKKKEQKENKSIDTSCTDWLIVTQRNTTLSAKKTGEKERKKSMTDWPWLTNRDSVQHGTLCNNKNMRKGLNKFINTLPLIDPSWRSFSSSPSIYMFVCVCLICHLPFIWFGHARGQIFGIFIPAFQEEPPPWWCGMHVLHYHKV